MSDSWDDDADDTAGSMERLSVVSVLINGSVLDPSEILLCDGAPAFTAPKATTTLAPCSMFFPYPLHTQLPEPRI